MQKPITRINLLAKRIGLSKIDTAMCLIYIMSHDKVLAWQSTKGQSSTSKHVGSMAQQAFLKDNIKQFIEDIGGLLAFESSLHLSMRGVLNKDTKELNNIFKALLINPSNGQYKLEKIEHVLSYAINNGLTLEDLCKRQSREAEQRGDNMAVFNGGDTDRMTDVKRQLRENEQNKNLIVLSSDMSAEDYLNFLIQEQGRTENQKDKNAFSLKISDYMQFKHDKTNELKPTIYLCNRESTSYLQRLSSLAKGTFNK